MVIVFAALGVLIGIPVLIGAMILFIPIRYAVRADNASGGFDLNLRISWFLGFFRIRYENKVFSATLFWFKRLGGKKKTRAAKKRNAAAKRAEKKEEPGNKTDILGYIKKAFTHPGRKVIWGYAKTLIRRVLRAIKPDKFKAALLIGFDDPALTGGALALCWAFRGASGLDIEASGASGKAFKYDVYVKDALFIWPLAFAAFCVKRPVWALIKRTLFKKDGEDGRKTKTDV